MLRKKIRKSEKRYCNHWSSLVREAKARYSVSGEDLEIVFWFFDFQHKRDEPRRTQYPVTDFQALWQHAQSESANPHSFKGLEA